MLLAIGSEGAHASEADGTWKVENLVVRVYDCQQRVCGLIVWMKEVAKRPSQCGQAIVSGLAPSAQNEWTGGAILIPMMAKHTGSRRPTSQTVHCMRGSSKASPLCANDNETNYPVKFRLRAT